MTSSIQQQKPTLDPLFLEVFDNRSLGELPSLISSYLTSEEFYTIFQAALSSNSLSYFNSSLKSRVELHKPNVLEKHLAPHLNTKRHLSEAVKIAARTYEAPRRAVAGGQGIVFPMNPEVLSYLMQLSYRKQVVELGAASGENSILLAYAGAEKVYVNDLSQTEMDSFQNLRKSLSQDVATKLEAVPGDALDFLIKKPTLAKKIDLVLCQNLLHFFTKEQQEKLFALLKQLLKPGGYALFVVNSIYSDSMSAHRNYFEKHPDISCVRTTKCYVTDYQRGEFPFTEMLSILCDREESEASPLAFEDVTLYRKEIGAQSQWKPLPGLYTLSQDLQQDITSAYQYNQTDLSLIPAGNIRAVTTDNRVYSKHTLAKLFHESGFKLEFLFTLAGDGHLVEEEDLYNKAQLIGILVRWLPEKEPKLKTGSQE